MTRPALRGALLLAAASLLGLMNARAQAPVVDHPSVTVNSQTLNSIALNGGPALADAGQLAAQLGLVTTRTASSLTFTLGRTVINFPLEPSLQSASRYAYGGTVNGTPRPGPAAAVSGGRVYAPAAVVAAGAGASVAQDGRNVRAYLAPARMSTPLQFKIQGKSERGVVTLDRGVSFTLALSRAGGATQVNVSILHARGTARMYTLPGARFLKAVTVKPSGDNLLASFTLPDNAGYRVWAGPASVIVEVNPALSTSQPALTAREATVVIDPGHGGTDFGAVGGGLLEKDVTLATARQLAQLLATAGVNVTLTRTSDATVSLDARRAASLKADVFISLHASSLAGSSRSGVTLETLPTEKADPALAASTPEIIARSRAALAAGNDYRGPYLAKFVAPADASLNLATALKDRLRQVKGVSIQDVSRPRLATPVLRDAPGAAVLVEVGWLSSPSDLSRLSPAVLDTADALAKGVRDYLKKAGWAR
ncbi:MAG TPA: N-acetylmuramoyl-L-alanine amidase [Deinococcales bacterium]|nr:N-acetylmuramoyl-L-alanine amidase [Deinococcales bacterium]